MRGWVFGAHAISGAALVDSDTCLPCAHACRLVPVALAAPCDDPLTNGALFGGLILLWSVGVAAQGPALTAIAQELAPKGSEAASLALPRAVGDAIYIVAPFALGLVTDSVPVRGAECGIAGALSLLGIAILALLSEQALDPE